MTVDYRTDDVGLTHLVTNMKEQDYTPVTVRGERLHRRITGHLQTRLFGDVDIAWTITKKGMTVERFGLVKPPKGGVTALMMQRLAAEYSYLVRNALWQAHAIRWADDKRPEHERLNALWLAIAFTMEPRRDGGESMAEYVYRLWVEMYEPEGRSQKELAGDLGKSYQLVRRYISEQRRLQSKGGKGK